jgi:hypothetical protein
VILIIVRSDHVFCQLAYAPVYIELFPLKLRVINQAVHIILPFDNYKPCFILFEVSFFFQIYMSFEYNTKVFLLYSQFGIVYNTYVIPYVI